jgi:glycosyltransferase involved in cell wall biosynthesis
MPSRLPNDFPQVSICVPTYNGRGHLAECINSIRAQTFADFEVLICDDDSPDGTLGFARELAQGDARFRFHANPRRFGLVGNWNNCIQQAKGEWIKYVFQDDIIAPDCIQRLVDTCRESGGKFAFCQRKFLFDNGCSESFRDFFEIHKQRLRLDYKNSNLIYPEHVARIASGQCMHNLVGEPTVTLIHQSVFRKVGLFDAGLIHLCDAEMWVRIMLNFGGVFVQSELATFRIHAKAATALNHGKRSYRANALDSLVIQYRFSFGSHFKLIRDPKITKVTATFLRRQCASSAFCAWRDAKLGLRSGDESMDAEWQQIKKFCPGIQFLARIGGFLDLCGRIRRKIARVLYPFIRHN